MPAQRPYDLVLFGATGFTGGLTAEYLARHAPAGCRWALAGRNPAKLAAVRGRLAAIDPACADLPLLTADASDPASLREVAGQARVVISTVGPYIRYGEPLVAACAEAGTDYVDLTGEPEFVDLMYVKHHARAVESGARLVHACGFDSVPHDLGALFTVGHLPKGSPISLQGFVRAGGSPSGGTLASALAAMSGRAACWRPRGAGARSSRSRWSAGCGSSTGCRAAPATPGRGSCRCPRSTRRWWPVPRPRCPRTARTSATGTSPPSSTCRSRWSAPSAWSCSPWPPNSRPCGGR
ncbi:hypothetical protein GCM10023235_67840 [Kitasatospora terrestris]|uniref:Saccharopine dehydrogenase NADP binding domain-containing protein n=1 Tax=Kitasatospora terrestris TaxID=258051 RepID=A0ABP9EI08_9ACTN